MNKKQNQLATPTEQRQEQERQTNEALLAEDAVQTTAYLANAPDCCSGAEQLDHVLGMLGSDVMDDGIYHSEDQHPKRNDHSDPVLSLYGIYKKHGRDAFLDAAKDYSAHVRDTVEDTLAEMESRWYDGGHTMTEAEKMVDDYNHGLTALNTQQYAEPVMAQPEMRM